MIRKILLFLTALVAVLTLTSPAHAGTVARTFWAYDLTQCSCTYSNTNQVAYVNGFPRATVTSYYDSTITDTAYAVYTRGTSVNLYHAHNGGGSLDGTPIYTTYEAAYVLCWVDNNGGSQMDKVAAKLTVNDTYAWFIFYIPDSWVHDYVRQSAHAC